jgi:hypothetical protein
VYRLPDERVSLDLDGPIVEVQRCASWMVYQQVVRLYAAYVAAKTPAAEYDALVQTFARFVDEAQPTWQIADHTGPVPPTLAGMTRLPLEMSLRMVTDWLETITPKASAVDAIIAPGPMRDELKRRLKAKKAA